ncbi:hypothetical protein LINGRAHAP2_LOCUS23203 [Linum grandiflorum]
MELRGGHVPWCAKKKGSSDGDLRRGSGVFDGGLDESRRSSAPGSFEVRLHLGKGTKLIRFESGKFRCKNQTFQQVWSSCSLAGVSPAARRLTGVWRLKMTTSVSRLESLVTKQQFSNAIMKSSVADCVYWRVLGLIYK